MSWHPRTRTTKNIWPRQRHNRPGTFLGEAIRPPTLIGAIQVGNYLTRARQAGLFWPLPSELDDDSLELLLFPSRTMASRLDLPVPDWAAMDVELRRPGVTRASEWYRARAPDGSGYAWVCEHFDVWKGRVRPTSHQRCAFSATRQTHVGGEKVFVDFAGDPIDVIDPVTGEARAMKLVVAAMGTSNYTYAEAVASEGLEHWTLAPCPDVLPGGVPKAVVPPSRQIALQSPAGQRII